MNKNNLRILVTGANGFIGSNLCSYLSDYGYKLKGVVRGQPQKPYEVKGPSLDSNSDWAELLTGVDVVVHTAARVHVMKESKIDALSAYRAINVIATLALARQAAQQRVKRFIFISSIKVNGEHTLPGKPFTELVNSSPDDPYGLSKYEAETALLALAKECNMEIVIIRPPLVYGPGVKGNFASMLSLVAKNYWLPLGAINNRRSFIAIDNMIDFIITCISHPAAANEVFLISDDDDLSTSQLFIRIASAMGKTPHLLSVPSYFLWLGATLIGKRQIAQRLLQSLQVDITKARNLLNWIPVISVDEELQRCIKYTKKG